MVNVKTMTKFGAALVISALAATSYADGDGRKGNGRGDRDGSNLERMTEYLSLTPAQVAEVEALYSAAREEREAAKEAVSAQIEAKKAEMESGLQAILTAEQWALFEERAAQRSEKGNGRRNRGKDSDSEV